MRVISLSEIVLALSVSISAQKSSSTTTSKSTPSTQSPLSLLSSQKPTVPLPTTFVSNTKSASPSLTTSAISASGGGGLLGKIISVVNSGINSILPIVPIIHVDTIGDTKGVPNTQIVLAARLPTFCSISTANNKFCKQLQNTISVCVDNKNNCTDTTARTLLNYSINNKLCATAPTGTVVDQICQAWFYEANRCNMKSKRGPCAYHHVLYLLKRLRDFLDLPKGQVSIVIHKKRNANVKKNRVWSKYF